MDKKGIKWFKRLIGENKTDIESKEIINKQLNKLRIKFKKFYSHFICYYKFTYLIV